MKSNVGIMKAAVIRAYGAPDRFEIAELPVPKVIHPKDVVVRVHYSCVNPVDYKIRQGNHKLWLRLKMPTILGFDFSGEIVETGVEVTEFKPGDFVFGLGSYLPGGAYAEYVRTRCDELVKIDALKAMHHAAGAMAGGTALVALQKVGELKGKKILINGAGSGVGHLAIQIAKQKGAEVYAVCSSRHQEIINFAKPHRHFDYQKEDFRQSGIQFHAIFDVTGTAPYPEVKTCLAKGGTFINILPRPEVLKNKFLGWINGHRVISFLFKPNRAILQELSEMISEGRIKVFIDSAFPLEEITKAHERSERHEASGKILINITQ
jgi:NADPH:quinone reductase-like Zn-dependent oxidoreductase